MFISSFIVFCCFFCKRWGRLSCFMYGVLYFGAFYSFRYCMHSGSLLKVVMGPVEFKILLSFNGFLAHGQSCHITFLILLFPIYRYEYIDIALRLSSKYLDKAFWIYLFVVNVSLETKLLFDHYRFKIFSSQNLVSLI